MTTSETHWETDQCCCPMCMSGIAEQAEDVDYTLDPSSNPSANNAYDKPIWSAYQTAQHLARQGSTWADDGNTVDGKTEITYRFHDETSAGNADHVFEDINKANTRKILDQYAEVANLVFTELNSDADINFKYRDGQNGGGFWNGSDVVVSRVGWESEMEAGTYNQRLMLHEIGHAMGLNHPGGYNGGGFNYADHAEYWNDSHQYSNMSYWSESNTDASFGNMSTLALHDILAIQIEYGVNLSTRTGDDTYGFNATTGDAYDFNSTRTNGSGNERSNTDMAFSIWDADGHDTIDFSGSSQGTTLDLREGAFSSVNGKTYNVSIAYGAVIEEGVGSDHNDTLHGNSADNTLSGGKGDDTLIGGNNDAAPASPLRAFTGISLNEDPNQFDQHLQADNITAFSGGAFTIDMMVDITRMSSSETTFASYATSSNADTFLVQGRPDGMLRIEINGVTVDTDIETLSLIDGQAHRLSVGWDAATGALRVHIDGALAWDGTLQAGETIATGGTLVFGQDQDSVGGGFNNRQTFQGTIGDIRIFDTQRTDEVIAQDAFSDPTDTAPIHHWTVTPKTKDTITDSGTGGWINLIAADPNNVTATQSSQWSSYDASRVIDGNSDTFNHTQNGATEFIAVSFETAVDAAFIEVINRNGNASRLEGAQVEVYDANGALITRFDPIDAVSWGSAHGFIVPNGHLVGEVRVVQSNTYLHVAEIRVLGGNGPGSDLTISNDAPVVTVGEVVLPTDADTLHGGDGQDTLYGGAGADQLNGDTGADQLFGGAGGDLLNGGEGTDTIYGGDGHDTVLISAGADENYGGDGRNMISGGADGTLLAAGTVIDMESGTQTQNGAAAGLWQGFSDYDNAKLTDATGAGETVRGDAADNAIKTGSNDNTLIGNDGHDTLDGGDGNDMFFGGAGDDHVISGRGNDTVHLGAGDDYVRVGNGSEKFYGGAGQDHISYFDSSGGVTLNLAKETASRSWASDDTVKGFENVTGAETGGDKIFGTAGANVIRTYGGNDSVYAGAGADKVVLGAGNDFVRAGQGKDKFDGGSGRDHISYTDSTKGVRIDLGDDKVGGSWATGDKIDSFEKATGSKTGSDKLFGTNGANVLNGQGGSDVLEGRGGADKLFGGGGADMLRGGRGNDLLDGGGGSGKDLLFGGKGADEFHFDRGDGNVVVKDFQNNVDTIELDNFKLKARDVFDRAQQKGADVVFDFGNGGTLTIEDIKIGKLHDDLILV